MVRAVALVLIWGAILLGALSLRVRVNRAVLVLLLCVGLLAIATVALLLRCLVCILAITAEPLGVVLLLLNLVFVAVVIGLSLRTYIFVKLLIGVAGVVWDTRYGSSLQRVESVTVKFVTETLEFFQSSIAHEAPGVHRGNTVHPGDTSDFKGCIFFVSSLTKLKRLGIRVVGVSVRVLKFLLHVGVYGISLGVFLHLMVITKPSLRI